MNNSKKQVFCVFDNKRVEIYFQDGSILQWRKQIIVYVSSKGIKNILSLQQIHRSQQLHSKFIKLIQYYNKYSTDINYINYAQDQFPQDSILRMGVKINEYGWQNPEIEQQKYGYQIKSDCGYATVLLHSNLYIVQIIYLQYLRSTNTYVSKVPNMTKLLLQKYNHQYAQLPVLADQKQKPEYYYTKCTKIYSIFNVPNQWKYPLHLIWNSLIQYKVIQHQFCYIEYADHQMSKRISMPSSVSPIKTNYNQNKQLQKQEHQVSSLPILGKIMHADFCQFITINDFCGWLSPLINILYDRYGFWFFNGSNVEYKRINKVQSDQSYHPKALPYTLRFKNQPQRTVLQQLKIFMVYCEENAKLKQLKLYKAKDKQTNHKFDNQNNLVYEQKVEDIGNFKAFSNGIVIVKFVDKTMLTLNSKRMEAKIIKKEGDTCCVDANIPSSFSYQQNKAYISSAIDFQERVFFPHQWVAKQQMSKSVEEVIEVSQVFQKTSLTYLKL